MGKDTGIIITSAKKDTVTLKQAFEITVTLFKQQQKELEYARKLLRSAYKETPEFIYDYEEFLTFYPDKLV